MEPLAESELTIGKKKVFENARELIEEAELLFNNCRFARAYALSHLAIEELEKILEIISVEFELQKGEEVNWGAFFNAFKDHKQKLRGVLLLKRLLACPRGKILGKDEIEEMETTVGKANRTKNSSLYTSIRNSRFQNPSDIISESNAKATLEYARIWLGYIEIVNTSGPPSGGPVTA